MGKNHPKVDDYTVSRVRALESLLLEKGLLAPDAVDRVVRRYEASTGPMIGARAVARAWRDETYHARLLQEPTAALADLGVRYDRLVVVENTPAVHNLVVCTLCSCYPWDVMGLPPTWYKAPAYRSRAVSQPRAVLAEFGLTVPEEREVHVWDSSAELRYMVMPMRPAGAQGLSEDELASRITREALIGVAEVTLPARAG
jgi:nitrile hydratase subunit alpha